MKKYILFIFILFLAFDSLFANKTDSLLILLNNTSGEKRISVLISLSKIYRNKSLDSSVFYAQQALEYSLPEKDNKIISLAYFELGNAHNLKGDTKEAIELYDKGIATIDNEDEELLNNLMLNKGSALTYSGKIDEGLKYFHEVLEYRKNSNDSLKIAGLLNNIGVINVYKGDYDAAMEYLLESVKIYENKGKAEDVAGLLGNIAVIYNEMGDYKKAIEYNSKAMEAYNQLDDYYEQTGLLINLGNIYKNIDSLNMSVLCCQQALNMAQKYGFTKFESLAYNNLGLVFEKQGNNDMAIDAISKSLEFSVRQNDNSSKAKNLRYLGRLYKKRGEYDLALKYLDESEQLANQINLVSDYHDIYFEKSEVYAALNNYFKSLEYYRKYTQVKDSIFNEEKHKQITEIKTKYETEKKEKELIQLSEENNKQKVIILKSRYFTFALIFLIFIVIIFSLLIIRQNKIRNRQKTLELEHKLFRSQMNPHFIFNSLTAIQYFIIKNQPVEAGAYLADFAKLMRLVIKNSREEYITLDQEVETMKYYLQMQKLRFDDSFNYEFNVDDSLFENEVMIPPMLTQPFIENALEHAFTGNARGNLLIIGYRYVNNHMEVIVEDNGIGRKQAAGLKKSNHKSFAIDLTQSRLEKLNNKMRNKIYFEIIDIVSETGNPVGTRVRFNIPLSFSF